MPFKIFAASLLAATSLVSTSAFAQVVTVNEGTQQRITDYIATAEAVGSAGGLLVTIGDETLISTGYGLANRGAQYPATPESVFDMGSLTKQFTAAAILVLQERGQLSVSDTLDQYFAALPADKTGITIHQLLTHTSGLSDHTGGYEGSDHSPYKSREDFFAALFASPLSREPGTSLEYSNAGYTVLAAIIEDISGMAYEHFLIEAVLDPAGMEQTGYRLRDWDDEDLAHMYFHGFLDPERADIGSFIHRWRDEEVSWHMLGNGGLYTTLVDMGKWHRALQDGTVLSAESTAQMHAPHVPWEEGDPDHYGYGWVVETGSEGIPVNHAGSNGLFNATIRRYPADDILIMHWTNESRPAADRMGAVVRRMLVDPAYEAAPVHASPYTLINQFSQSQPIERVTELPAHLEMITRRTLSDRRILNRVGFHLLSEERGDWAVALFELNTTLFPDDGNLYDSLGEGQFALGNTEAALAAFRTSLALAPDDGGCGWCDNARTRIAELETGAQ